MAEKDHYEPIKKEFEKLLSSQGTVHLEITANKVYSNKLKAEIPEDKSAQSDVVAPVALRTIDKSQDLSGSCGPTIRSLIIRKVELNANVPR